MTKYYEVNGLVIKCETTEEKYEVCTNEDAVIYLYSEPVYEIRTKTKYIVQVIDWYGTHTPAKGTILCDQSFYNKDEANEWFKIMVANAKN